MECTFCKRSFSTKPNLMKHQKTAKYCVKIQSELRFICKACDKELSCKQSLTFHYKSCKKYKSMCENQNKKDIGLFLQQENLELKDHVKELENKLENIALKAVSKPSIVTNNTNNSKTQINYLRPISDERFNESIPELTLEYLLKGPPGYAQFALDHPLKDSVICSDYARRKVEYKEDNGLVKTDPEMTYISSKFFRSIRNKNKELLVKYSSDIYEGDDCEFIEDETKKISDYITSVNKGSQGEKTDFHHDFVKEVCCRTVKDEKDK